MPRASKPVSLPNTPRSVHEAQQSASLRRSKRTVKRVSYQVDPLPFPEGKPTDPEHFALLSFCHSILPSARLAEMNNICVYTFFSTKHATYRKNALSIRPLPAQRNFVPYFYHKARKVLYSIAEQASHLPIDNWEVLARTRMIDAKRFINNDDLKIMMESEDFLK